MRERSMIVVAAGSSKRFGDDKLMTSIDGAPLIAHTLRSIVPLVDVCLLVARADQVGALEELGLGVEIVPGGDSRTASEAAGLAAIETTRLIGIHDGARPLTPPALIETLFTVAADNGGAVPGIAPANPVVDRETLAPIHGAVAVQTPQVFWGPELKAAFRAAAHSHFTGHDTADVVTRFTNLEVRVVPGDPDNIKITYPEDLSRLAEKFHS